MAAVRLFSYLALALFASVAAPASATAAALHDVCRGDFQPLTAPSPELGQPTAFLLTATRMTGDQEPQLILAQRAIERDLHPEKPQSVDSTEYAYVEVEGWKSPGLAAGMSAILPGTGQLYAGSNRGYVFLGIQALALYTYFHFDSKADDNQQEAFAYAGDPSVSTSKWSFDRYEQEAGRDEADQMRQIYAQDPAEFYSRVSTDPQYFAGWAGTDDSEKVESVAGYRILDEDRIDARRASRLGLFAAIANSVVSAVDAFRQARLTNLEIQQDWNLRFKAQTGSNAGFTAYITHRFH
jgi:hypothetical protein